MKCDICEQETETTYDLVLFHCGLRYKLCRKCYCKALGKKELGNDLCCRFSHTNFKSM